MQQGLVQGLQQGLLGFDGKWGGPGAASYTLNTLTVADIAVITGKPEPGFGWDAGVASGANDLVGTDHLVDVGTPTKEVDDATMGGLCTSWLNASSDGLNAASSAIADPGAVTVTGMLIFRFNDALTGTVRGLVQKRNVIAGNQGWEIYSQNRELFFVVDTVAGTISRNIATDHGTSNAQVILFTRSVANNVGSIWSREGSAEGTRNADTLTNAAVLAIGAGTLRTSAVGEVVAKLFLWHGTDGDGFGEADRLAVSQALTYEA